MMGGVFDDGVDGGEGGVGDLGNRQDTDLPGIHHP